MDVDVTVSTAAVPVRLIRSPEWQDWWAYVADVGLGCYHNPEHAVRAAAEHLQRCMAAHRLVVLLGARGDVLVVRWYVDGYVVERVRPGLDRNGADWQSAPFGSLFDAMAHARRMAERLGGVDWETHLF